LLQYGEVSLAYVTAEFAPFSDQFKPDIIFVPKVGANVNATYFIELRLGRARPLPPASAKALREHRSFAEEASEGSPFYYGFATDERISSDISVLLADEGVKVFSEITTAESLAYDIAVWAGVL
jgi:hypothetical protein